MEVTDEMVEAAAVAISGAPFPTHRSRQKARAALAAANARVERLEEALEEFANPRNWVVNGRFDPHAGNFDATTFARAALTGGEDAR